MVIIKFYNNREEDGYGYRLVMTADSYTHTRNTDGTNVVSVGDVSYTVGDGCEFASMLVVSDGNVVDRVVHGWPSNHMGSRFEVEGDE